MRLAPHLLSLAVVLGACTDPDTDTDTGLVSECGAPYAPFAAGNYENQLLRVGAYEQIVAIRKSETFSATDFDTIESLYTDTADLQVKVQGRTDDHEWASTVAIGTDLDADITAAIAAGKAGTDIKVQGQIIDKTLQHFFGLSVFHEGMKAADESKSLEDMQAGWDEGFGYFGVTNDGTEVTGIANTLSKRDAEFGTSLVDEGFNGLLEGRCALEDGDPAAALEALDDVDAAILQGFALSVVHEMDEYTDDPLIKGWEALLYWDAVADYTAALDPTAAAAIQAEMDKGAEGMDPTTVRTQLITAWGFSL